MFSYLKHGHRRPNSTASSPLSPLPGPAGTHDCSQSQYSHDLPQPLYATSPAGSASRSSGEASPVSPLPPTLPPIPRVASTSERDARHGDVQDAQLPSSLTASTAPTISIHNTGPSDLQARRHLDHAPLRIDTAAASTAVPVGNAAIPIPPAYWPFRRQTPRDGVSPSSNAATDPLSLGAGLAVPEMPRGGSFSGSSQSSSAHSSFRKITGARGPAPDASAPQQPVQLIPLSGRPVRTRKTLNPVHLLRRRRTTVDPASPDDAYSHTGVVVPAMKLPEDYDPRIRGTQVHDFSFPRSRRNYSDGGPGPSLLERQQTQTDPDVKGAPDERDDIHAETLATEALAPGENPEPQRSSKSTIGAASLRNSVEHSTTSSVTNETLATSPSASPVQKAADDAFGFPRHFSSTASRNSRFSFQLHSAGTVEQEKELEEKAKRRGHGQERRDSQLEDDDAYFDDFDGETTYEEEIPLVGGDDEESAAALGAPAEEATWTSESSSQPTVVPSETDHFVPDADDMYFDDGNFDGGNFDEPSQPDAFDETVFDSVDRDYHPDEETAKRLGHLMTQTIDNGVSASLPSTLPSQDLQAWHGSLASATADAAAAGRFQRQPSVTSASSDLDWYGNAAAWSEDFAIGTDVSSYDDPESDSFAEDPMIAEANADVLASEDADFYGSEFGFYGAGNKAARDVVNGGFFSPVDELQRTKSGRNVQREPNLTPITEGSEFSARTSVVSLVRLGSNSALPVAAQGNPGLRELAAGMGEHDGMDLGQLMQWRKAAFASAGSKASPPGSAHSLPDNLPSSARSTHSPSNSESGIFIASARHARQRSDSIDSPASASSSPLSAGVSRPTSIEGIFRKVQEPRHGQRDSRSSLSSAHSPSDSLQHPQSPQGSGQFQFPQGANLPTITESQFAKFSGRPPASSATYAERERERHRRSTPDGGSASSDPTSVAYVMENQQWYLERRRRQSSGELVVIGRELVEGGRI